MKTAFACAVTLRRERAFAEANTLLASLLERAPEHPRLLTELGNLRYREGNFRAAEAVFRRVLAIAADDEGAAASLCMLYAHVGRHDEAAAYASLILATEARDPLTWYTLGIVFAWRRDWPRSLEYSRVAVAMDERFTDAHYNCACAYAQLDNPCDALGHLSRGLGNFGLLLQAETDPDLDPLRGHAEFEDILARARERLDQDVPA